MNKFTTAIGALALCSCAMAPGTGQVTPAQSVYAAEGAYAVALRSAVAYRQLPKCTMGVVICHDPIVVQRLVVADNKAHAALLGAEALVRAKGTDQQIEAAVLLAKVAIADFSFLIPHVGN